MRYFVYILFSPSNDRFYIGQTAELSNRLSQHNSGMVKSTAPYRPWEMVWYQIFGTRSEAMIRERRLKNRKSQRAVILYMNKYGQLNPKCSAEFFSKNSSILAESKISKKS